MVLECDHCGGAVEIDPDKTSYGDDMAFEAYECVSCGRRGTYSFGNGTERMSGCVTANQY